MMVYDVFTEDGKRFFAEVYAQISGGEYAEDATHVTGFCDSESEAAQEARQWIAEQEAA